MLEFQLHLTILKPTEANKIFFFLQISFHLKTSISLTHVATVGSYKRSRKQRGKQSQQTLATWSYVLTLNTAFFCWLYFVKLAISNLIQGHCFLKRIDWPSKRPLMVYSPVRWSSAEGTRTNCKTWTSMKLPGSKYMVWVWLHCELAGASPSAAKTAFTKSNTLYFKPPLVGEVGQLVCWYTARICVYKW